MDTFRENRHVWGNRTRLGDRTRLGVLHIDVKKGDPYFKKLGPTNGSSISVIIFNDVYKM